MSRLGAFLDRLINGPSRDGGAPSIRLPEESSQGEQDIELWPVEPTTGQPLPPRQQPGYYPGYHTLGQKDFWDEATRKLVLERVHDVPAIRFFSAEEVTLMEAVVDRLLPQDDRREAYRIPIVPQIDKKLYENIIPGYRYEDMPPEQEAFRLGLQGIQAVADHLFGKSFVDLGPTEQDQVLLTLHDGKPPAGEEIWKQMAVTHFWVQILSYCCEAYYAHPYAWDEIGFGGPAYPRGYYRLLNGEPEPWEKEERRYAWAPPPSCLSDADEAVGHGDITYLPGQAGTH
ncbi:MAG TPA: gluconate 2-dehydrogenase subunit 3 family protein [Chloroflexota bacterium]|nr:gluconate 2-dehydrogenase subunit 3 family protein [Chloroflexota bacterium]